MKKLAALLLSTLVFGCAHVHVQRPFADVNTMVVVAGRTNIVLGSAKALIIDFRQTPGQDKGSAEPKPPQLVVANFDELRDVKLVDKGVSVGAHAIGNVHSRQKVLVYRSGYEPAWLEKKLIGKKYRYPTVLALVPCTPVRSRRLAFDAVSYAFRDESEKVRQAALKKLAEYLN